MASSVTRYTHLYLSPHLDDAVLSCGGAIARHVAAGEQVLVVTICAGSPPPGTSFSPFAQQQHARWGLPPAEAVARRRAEDRAALALLGADALQLDLLDAIYRMPAAYVDDRTLFGPVAPDDPLAAALRPRLEALLDDHPGATIYAPLGVGQHVDHQAVYAVAARLATAGATVWFYEDVPYVLRPGALDARLAALGGRAQWEPVVVPLGAAVPQKIAAIAAYASQIATLFGDRERMGEAVAAYAEQVAPPGTEPAERLWRR